jgi:hypothetical protein
MNSTKGVEQRTGFVEFISGYIDSPKVTYIIACLYCYSRDALYLSFLSIPA